jgi:hypothetical protein
LDRAPDSEAGGCGFNSHQERLKLKITSMMYRYVAKYDFWDITYKLNDNKDGQRIYLSAWRLGGEMPPNIISRLLRAEMCCEPIRGKETQ